MLNVVFVSPHSDPQAKLGEQDAGGQCVYEHELALYLSKMDGVSVTTFCRQTGERPDVSEVTDRYCITRIHVGDPGFLPKERMSKVIPEFASQMHARLGNSDYLIHAHYWDGARTALQLNAIRGNWAPLVWTPHSLGATKRLTFPGGRQEQKLNFIPRIAWENYAAFMADRVIVSTKREEEDLHNYYAVSDRDVDVVAPGVGTKFFTSSLQKTHSEVVDTRVKLGFPREGKVILCVGRMVSNKGFHHAVKALAELKKRLKEPCSLVIVGGVKKGNSEEERSYISEIEQLASQLGVDKDIHFVGSVDHERMALVYKACDVLLVTAQREPFGLTILEAMASGTPVVAANSGGAASLIVHNRTGSVVQIDDSGRVAAYILALFKDDYLRGQILERASAFVRKSYSWEVIANDFVTVYEQANESVKRGKLINWMSTSPFLEYNLR